MTSLNRDLNSKLVVDNPNFKKAVGLPSMVAFSLGNIIGSGILILPAVTASMGGGLTPLIWLLGGVMLLPVVVVYSILAKMYPVVGSKVRFVNATHGRVLASSVGWLYLIGTLLVIPVEAEASLQYLGYIFPSLWNRGPTPLGYLVEISIVVAIYLLVFNGIKSLSFGVNTITYAKLGILAIYAISVGVLSFHVSNFSLPITGPANSFFEAVALTMFAYGGFRSAMVYAGESRTKNEAGRAVLLAFVISMAMYAIIPAVFIASLSPGILSHGWSGLATMKAPLAQSAVIAGIPALGALFILDGIISPSGASLIGAGDVSRYAYSLAKIRALPKVAGKVSEKRGIPILPTILALVASVGMLFFSPTFSESVKYLVAAHVLAYATGPASLFVLSELKSNKLLSVIAFALTALLYTWVGFPATLLGVAVTGFSILAMGLFNRPVKPAIWYLGFSLTMAGISLLSIDVEIPLALITSILFLYIAKRTAAGQDELEI